MDRYQPDAFSTGREALFTPEVRGEREECVSGYHVPCGLSGISRLRAPRNYR